MLKQTEFLMQGAEKTTASPKASIINLNESWRVLDAVMDELQPNFERDKAFALAFMKNANRITKQ